MTATSFDFWDKIANKYAKTPIADEESYQKKLAMTREFFNAGSEVLEFGCGTGGTAILHSPYAGRIHAIDVSSRMIDIAKSKKAEAKVANVEFSVGSIEGFSASPKSYDVITGMSILHLLEDKEAVFKKVHSLLKDDGVFISSTTCMNDSLWYLKLLMPLFPIVKFFGWLPKYLRFFSSDDLVKSLEQSGFNIDHEWRQKGKATFIVASKR